MSETTTVIFIEGRLEHRDVGRIMALPFDVPEQVRRMDVLLEFNDRVGSESWLTEGNALDIGIFDSRENDNPSMGFRGWTGSARVEFFIDSDSATPGYLSGPIQPGTWHMFLGVFKVWDKGCNYKFTITCTIDAEKHATAVFPTFLPLRSEVRSALSVDGWYKGDLHCHTLHSDGDSEPEDVVHEAERLGLDFLAVTDHNTQSHQVVLQEIQTPVMLIPGIEVSTLYGHWNIWGDFDWIDFRADTPEKMEMMIDEAKRRGYLTSCNHPRPDGPDWRFESVQNYDCIEVWNSPWLREKSHYCLTYYEARLNEGKRFIAVGGSDNHSLKDLEDSHLAQPTTYVYCPEGASPVNILAAMRKGHVFMSESPTGPLIHMNSGDCMMGDDVPRSTENRLPLTFRICGGAGLTLQLVGKAGVMLERQVMMAEESVQAILNVSDTNYVYARLASGQGDAFTVHCVTNPIWCAFDESV